MTTDNSLKPTSTSTSSSTRGVPHLPLLPGPSLQRASTPSELQRQGSSAIKHRTRSNVDEGSGLPISGQPNSDVASLSLDVVDPPAPPLDVNSVVHASSEVELN